MQTAPAQPIPSTRLRGAWTWLARAAWAVIVLGTSAMYVLSQTAPKPLNIPLDLYNQLPAASRSLYDGVNTVTEWISVAFYLLVGLVIFWRKSDDWMALLVSLALITFGLATFTDGVKPAASIFPFLAFPTVFAAALGQGLIALFFYLFPDGRFVPRIAVIPCILWFLFEVVPYFFPNSIFAIDSLTNPLNPYADAIWPFFMLTFLGSQLYRYFRSSNPFQRRQTKWVTFGILAALTSFMVIIFSTLSIPESQRTWVGYIFFNTGLRLVMLLIPLSVGTAILRSHLWDIDVVIRRTLFYATLIVVLGVVYLGSILLLQQLFQRLIFSNGAGGSTRPGIEVVLSTLLVVALFNPLRLRVQSGVDRRFYRQKYDAERILVEFSAAITSQVDIDETKRTILLAVNQTLQPENVSIWLKE